MKTQFEEFVHQARQLSNESLEFLASCVRGSVEDCRTADRILAAKLIIGHAHGKDAAAVPDENVFDTMSLADQKKHLYDLINTIEEQECRFQ
jgi:hypothetical protein